MKDVLQKVFNYFNQDEVTVPQELYEEVCKAVFNEEPIKKHLLNEVQKPFNADAGTMDDLSNAELIEQLKSLTVNDNTLTIELIRRFENTLAYVYAQERLNSQPA